MSTSNKRVIIGNEDDDAKVSVTQRGLTKAAMAVEILDASGNQVTSFGGIGTSVGSGTKTVTTAGVAVQLSSTGVPCKRVWIQAHTANSGVFVVGDSNVVAASSGRRGRGLYSTQGDWFNVNNLNLIYVDSTNSGDKCHFYYEN